MDILFDTQQGRFSYRVAGLAAQNGRLLVQRARGDDGLAVPGGHVKFGETTAEALRREFREELGVGIEVGELAAVGEVFFDWNGPCQQICLYYRVEVPDGPWEGVRHGFDDSGNVREEIDFFWVPVEELAAGKHLIYPPQVPEWLKSSGVRHFVYREN